MTERTKSDNDAVDPGPRAGWVLTNRRRRRRHRSSQGAIPIWSMILWTIRFRRAIRRPGGHARRDCSSANCASSRPRRASATPATVHERNRVHGRSRKCRNDAIVVHWLAERCIHSGVGIG